MYRFPSPRGKYDKSPHPTPSPHNLTYRSLVITYVHTVTTLDNCLDWKLGRDIDALLKQTPQHSLLCWRRCLDSNYQHRISHQMVTSTNINDLETEKKLPTVGPTLVWQNVKTMIGYTRYSIQYTVYSLHTEKPHCKSCQGCKLESHR